MFAQDRMRMRETFAVAWRKRCAGSPMTPLEGQIADVVAMHPEYHGGIEDPLFMQRDFGDAGGQSNPYLHMALHLSLREQRDTDRPPGVRALLRRLVRRIGDPHAAEHAAMDCLGEALWRAQSAGVAVDESAYLAGLRTLTRQ
jgi:hypothetical protein